MENKKIPIEQLKKAKYNPRIIDDKEMTALKKSIMKFGFVEPIVVNNDMTVIAGHQRLRACEELGKKEPVSAVIIDISKKEEKALNLALNKISGTWDVAKLYEVINELRTEDELEFTGFDEKEVSKILDSMIEESEKVDELPEDIPAKAKRGDLFLLGGKVKCPKCGKEHNA